jgi:hypothetical protein
MSKLGLLGYVATLVPGLLQVRRSTWIAAGAGLLVLLALMAWAAVALIGGLWGQARNLSATAPDVVRDATRAAVGQVDVIVPGVREKLGEFVPALKAEPPPRDVSGTDVGPVARYPGLARDYWHREGREITVRYEGCGRLRGGAGPLRQGLRRTGLPPEPAFGVARHRAPRIPQGRRPCRLRPRQGCERRGQGDHRHRPAMTDFLNRR